MRKLLTLMTVLAIVALVAFAINNQQQTANLGTMASTTQQNNVDVATAMQANYDKEAAATNLFIPYIVATGNGYSYEQMYNAKIVGDDNTGHGQILLCFGGNDSQMQTDLQTGHRAV